jgi:hypothetical protein
VNTVVQQAVHIDLTEPVRKTGVANEAVPAPSSLRKYIAIGTGVTGVAAVGIGLLVGAKAISTYNQAKALCANLTCDSASYEKGSQLIHDARFDATVSTVLVAVGGAAIVTGVIVFLTTPREREQSTARIVPVIHDRGTGLAIIGRF